MVIIIYQIINIKPEQTTCIVFYFFNNISFLDSTLWIAKIIIITTYPFKEKYVTFNYIMIKCNS